MLRLMAWLCTKDGTFGTSQMCIVTGPNIDIATKLIKRLKTIFEPKLGLTFQNKETVVELNGCRIEAYPSNHIDSFRSLDNPKFILLDEADFFRKGEQEDVRHVSERYIGKSDPYDRLKELEKYERHVKTALIAANNHYAGFGPATSNAFREMLGMTQVAWGIEKEIPRKVEFEEIRGHKKRTMKQTSLSEFISK